jgi:hypothetical protein
MRWRAKAQDAVLSGKCLESTQSSYRNLGGRWDLRCQVPGYSWLHLRRATRDEALANIHDAIRLCLSVVSEDHAKPTADAPEVEMIEARTSDFLEAG